MQTFLNGCSLSRQQQQQQATQQDQLSSPPLTPSMAGGGSSSSSLSRGRPSTEGGEAPRQAFAPSRPFISASSIPHHTRDEGEEAASKCLLAHGVLLLDVDVHGLLHSREPLAGEEGQGGGGKGGAGARLPLQEATLQCVFARTACSPSQVSLFIRGTGRGWPCPALLCVQNKSRLG